MTKVRYVRLFADADGESYFSDEEMDLRSVDFAPPSATRVRLEQMRILH